MAKQKDFTGSDSLNQRSRFQYIIGVVGLDLTGFTGKMQIKSGKESGAALYFDASTYVSVDVVGSRVIIDIPGSATVGQSWLQGSYDVLLTHSDPTKDTRILQGSITLDRQVTA